MPLYSGDYTCKTYTFCPDHWIKEICDGRWSEIMGTHFPPS